MVNKIVEGSSTLWHKINNFLVIAQRLGLFDVTLWPSAVGGQNIMSKLLRAKSSENFVYSLEQGRGDTTEGRSYDV